MVKRTSLSIFNLMAVVLSDTTSSCFLGPTETSAQAESWQVIGEVERIGAASNHGTPRRSSESMRQIQ
jgi:hypothetical protein